MADREEPKYGRCTIAAALGCVAYYILYFFKSFAYDGLLMGGLTAATAAAALPLKIPASIFNGAVAHHSGAPTVHRPAPCFEAGASPPALTVPQAACRQSIFI